MLFKDEAAFNKAIVTGWVVLLLAICVSTGVWAVSYGRGNLKIDIARHEARIHPTREEPGKTPADTTMPDGAKPMPMYAGIYVDRIETLSVQDQMWKVDFYIWFRWEGEHIDPMGNFQLVDGWIENMTI